MRETVFTVLTEHGEREFVLDSDSSEMGCFGPMLSPRGAAFLDSIEGFIELLAINGQVSDDYWL
jgi:hypothetical protein